MRCPLPAVDDGSLYADCRLDGPKPLGVANGEIWVFGLKPRSLRRIAKQVYWPGEMFWSQLSTVVIPVERCGAGVASAAVETEIATAVPPTRTVSPRIATFTVPPDRCGPTIGA